MNIREINMEMEYCARHGTAQDIVHLLDSRRRILETVPAVENAWESPGTLLAECIECNRRWLPVLHERIESLRNRIGEIVPHRDRLRVARGRASSHGTGCVVNGCG